MARINITRLVILPGGRPISTQYFTQVDCSLLFYGYGLHYNARSANEEIILCYIVQEEYAIFHSGSLFTLFYMVMGCNIIQEVKGLT